MSENNDDDFTVREAVEYYNTAIKALKSMPAKIEQPTTVATRFALKVPWER